MKRCKFCGRHGIRMLELAASIFSTRPSGIYACYDRDACRKRAAKIGQWTGVRVLQRRDLDGTHWTIRRRDNGGYALRCVYRKSCFMSQHPTIDAAKTHADDLLASWRAHSLKDYAEPRR